MTDRNRRRISPLILVGALLSGCAAAASPSQPPASASHPPPPQSTTSTITPAPTASASFDVLSVTTVEGSFPVGADGHQLWLECYGHGAPTIVIEAGTDSSPIDDFPDAFVRPLAETNEVCLYDRIGTGRSDAPTAARRTFKDVVADFDSLFAAAKIPPPYLLVGQSGGGNIAVYYASVHPRNVAGLVLIDADFDDPDEIAKEFPGAQAWAGSEHIDSVDAARLQSRIRMPIADFPVLIITADHNEASSPRPSAWRKLSPNAREIVKHGSHNLHHEIPEELANEIRSLLATL